MSTVTGVLIAIAAIAGWGVARTRRARRAVRRGLEQQGCQVLRLERRVVRQGPLFWTSTPPQVVFRAVVSRDGGPPQIVWARWGRTWLPGPDRLEIRWQ